MKSLRALAASTLVVAAFGCGSATDGGVASKPAPMANSSAAAPRAIKGAPAVQFSSGPQTLSVGSKTHGG
ncbi:MAG TPA: hypothetical protein VG944_17270 [Fimbriimonas sp.]|nr:hypothetical protein [Fimbriimonas sp.]